MMGKEIIKIGVIFEKNGLHGGRMISGSKSLYKNKYPTHDILFNANIIIKDIGKVWYGDLDITLDCFLLQEICNEIGIKMIIVSEMLGRFGAEDRIYEQLEDDAHCKFIPNSKVYFKRIYEGMKNIPIDNINVITSKGVDWKEISYKDKDILKTFNEIFGIKR